MFDEVGERVTRLDAVKLVLNDFIDRREADRIGLIVFGSAAYLQTPFTDDHLVWAQLLEETEIGMAGQSTVFGDAIGLAIKLFRESASDNRVLIILTDGNDTGSRVPPDRAAEIAHDHGITIHAIAVGDPSAAGEGKIDIDGRRVDVMIIGQQKGRDMKENLWRNFGSPHPEGYRKALRLMQQAEKFGRPVITFIDTPGAYPGLGAEERGQAEAIGRAIETMSQLSVPVITTVMGEGGSGGALAIGVALTMANFDRGLFDMIQSVIGFIAPPVSAVFLIGVLWRRATSTAALSTLGAAAA